MKIKLKVNGRLQQVVADPSLTLLDLLRDVLHLTGAKQSCDKAGQCGACTVIVNGKAVRSCLLKVAKLDGAEVITVEGLGTPENPHLIQEAMVLAGAVQCGFCTPGIIMSAKALLDVNPDPDTEEIKKALRHNLCRCTGYAKIIDAVKLAGRFIRNEISPDDVRPDPDGPKYGVSHPRPSGLAKACGTAQFTADIIVPGALELATVRSPHPHALIKKIDFAAAEQMPGVIGVMTAKDILGTNRLKYSVADRPVLCEDKVRYIGDAVAVIAALTRQQAVEAAKAVEVEYELLPVLSSPGEAMAEGALQLYDDRPNLCFIQPQIKGDAAKALAESATVIESHFTTQINHQAPLEPEACVAYFEGGGEDAQLVVIGRSINIHKHLDMLQEALGWENMRYEEAYTGGQFGMKLEISSEGIAAGAALHFKRPVRYIPGIAESMLMTPKRHPFDMKVKLGADSEGRITAYDIDIVVDNGAYHSNGDVIINRAMQMLSGAYNIPHLHAVSKLVYTNNPWGSAARGAGPPQAHFALECAVNMLADKLGLDPLEMRILNSLQPGQSKSTGSVVEQWPFPELCAAMRPHYERSLLESREHKKGVVRRGVGLGAGAFGIGGPGDQAIVAIELDPDDGVTIYAAVADPGEGNDSMLTQLAADGLGLPLDKIRLMTKNTDQTTATGPAAGSRMTYMVGGALVNAVEQLKQAMRDAGAATYQELIATGRPVRYTGTKTTLEAGPLDPETGQGPSFESVVHALQLAEVEVNTETGEVKVLKMTTAVDSGPVINPKNFEGQLEGGADMGAGFALREQYIAGQTKDWITFKFPSIRTAFEMESIIRETPRLRGTGKGSTGVGEMTMVPTAPAIISAIKDAIGVWICDLPATPEKIKAALQQRG
ncbi:aldehyde oxidoreductase [Desulfotomaculum arcticum]|uniref:Aldehyde oxidoreductase n=1 Tax=Desulfotruncus arcticus DSM 17038 TaxID=1121424 RepID=A0A1I2QQ20_9FIRM|nr:molybdopterin cofactor-binding domain-containing protein [Desulfotruncus arcticus]SFG29763.1 aldehyde oxidoreductase [Desulfotomaculum arcticum] [Desulfotruncus arcticus DSM 17038]